MRHIKKILYLVIYPFTFIKKLNDEIHQLERGIIVKQILIQVEIEKQMKTLNEIKETMENK